MTDVLLDTAGWLASMSPRFEDHESALAAITSLRKQRAVFLTTSLVIGEMHGLLAGRMGATAALEFLDETEADPGITVVEVDLGLRSAAIQRWLRVYRDVPFSLCDAVSFEVMRREGLTQAFTLDRHFSVAGYTMLPAVPKPRRKR